MKCAVPLGLACLAVLLPTDGNVLHANDANLAQRAQAILKSYCHRCHGQDGAAKGGFEYVLDRTRLLAGGKVIPGRSGESDVYQQMRDGTMPPPGQKPRPSAEEVELVRQWIDAGAPAAEAMPVRAFISTTDVRQLIAADLATVEPRQQRFIRYLLLTHLHNAGRSESELQACRQGVAKLLNSLSWHPRITVPPTIDPTRTILRVDLRDYKWNARSWDRLVAAYPYRSEGEDRDNLIALRADWFVATASRPPLYHDLLGLPTTDRELERQLRVEALLNIQEETVVRAGFNGSGVSQNNRLLERHDAAYGAYWRSYDFNASTGRQNLFEHPLGPTPGQNSFVAAGGEIIFHLPNGLQGYLLVDAAGRRVDRAPIEIVSDPQRPDRTVEVGLSCMSCHAGGLIPKADQIGTHAARNPQGFTAEEIATIRALYPPAARMRTLLDDDNRRYLQALQKVGVAGATVEPITSTALRYEAALDLAALAAELGLPVSDFAQRLEVSVTLVRLLGSSLTRGGTIQRQTLQAAFPEVARTLRLGGNTAATIARPPAVEQPAVPFAGHDGKVFALAFAPVGQLAASAGEDRVIRFWDIPNGTEVFRFEGHTLPIRTLAFSADGLRLLSAGEDRTLRLWDLIAAKTVQRFTGHTDAVYSVALSLDGRQALSGGADRTLRLWDIDGGRELACLAVEDAPIHAVAISPDGRQALSGTSGGGLALWDLPGRRLVRRLAGHARSVYAVAFSPDGRLALSGGEDRTVRLWDLEAGSQRRRLDGHANAVIRVAFTPDGRYALSGSSQYQTPDQSLRRWDLQTGQPVRLNRGTETDGVVAIAFSPEGRWALTARFERPLRLWSLAP